MDVPFTHRNLPRLLLQAREGVMTHLRPSLRKHGLSDQQWRVLRVLGEHGTADTGRVAREAFILGPSLTGVLARMQRDGLIRRTRDPADQRRTVVAATARGSKLVARISVTVEAHYQWMEKTLGTGKLAQLYRLLDELIDLEHPSAAHRQSLRASGTAREANATRGAKTRRGTKVTRSAEAVR